MENKSLFMPINAASLAHYFGGACILPSRYYTNKPEDLQDKYDGLLLLSSHLGTKHTNCCLEIVFDDEEFNELIDVRNGFFLYEKPLPITRIKHIFFTSKEQRDTTVTNIRLGTSFVPDNLIRIVNTFEDVDSSNVVLPDDIVINDFSTKQKDFDKILGGLAVMKVAHLDYMNYSENYFSTLSYFSDLIASELAKANKVINNKLQAILVGDKQNRLHKFLYEPISDSLVEHVAAEEKQTIQKHSITKLINLDSLDGLTYIIAVLNTYGTDKESRKKKVDSLFLSRFNDGIKQGKGEGIALCYGISRGYSAFRNSYEYNDIKVDVKYKLDSLLDYYTIESIYQYVYNSRKSRELPILNWVQRKNTRIPKCDTDYIVIDEYVIGKKKPSVMSVEYIKNLLSRFFQDAAFMYFENLMTEIRNTIYADAKKEIEEGNSGLIKQFEDQILSINSQHAKKVAELERRRVEEVNSLKTQLDAVKCKLPISTLNNRSYQQDEQQSSQERNTVNQIIPEIDKVSIIKEVLLLKNKPKEELKRMGQERNIAFDKKDKVDDMIIKIIIGKVDEPKIF